MAQPLHFHFYSAGPVLFISSANKCVCQHTRFWDVTHVDKFIVTHRWYGNQYVRTKTPIFRPPPYP